MLQTFKCRLIDRSCVTTRGSRGVCLPVEACGGQVPNDTPNYSCNSGYGKPMVCCYITRRWIYQRSLSSRSPYFISNTYLINLKNLRLANVGQSPYTESVLIPSQTDNNSKSSGILQTIISIVSSDDNTESISEYSEQAKIINDGRRNKRSLVSGTSNNNVFRTSANPKNIPAKISSRLRSRFLTYNSDDLESNSISVESASVNSTNARVESASINSKDSRVDSATVNSTNSRVESATVNSTNSKVESATVNSKDSRVESATVNSTNSKVESVTVNSTNSKIESVTLNSTSSRIESVTVNSTSSSVESVTINSTTSSVSTTSIFPEPPVCGVSQGSFSRVVNGNNASLGDFPWAGAIAYNVTNGFMFKCGSSLITSRHSLTAAHCIVGLEDSIYFARFGVVDLSNFNDRIPVDRLVQTVIVHEDYDRKISYSNDIGLLVLHPKITFNDYVRPICLPLSEELRTRDFVDYHPFVAGFGRIRYRGPPSPRLQMLQLPVVSEESCKEAYAPLEVVLIDHRVLCAGGPGKDSCNGDSGGPLMQPIWDPNNFTTYFYQLGVVSLGLKCGTMGLPGVYTRVSEFVPWIQINVFKTQALLSKY